MATVAAAEVQKNFGQYREAALADPVVVTSYGKPSVVILSIDEYERLKELDRRVLHLAEMSDDQLDEMIAAEIPAELRYSLDDIPGPA